PSALCTALAAVAVFALARRLDPRRAAAWCATALFATTPAVLVNGRRAMMEGAPLFFSALTVLVAVVVASRWETGGRRAAGLAVLGAVAGLALASKHTALL